MEEGYSWDSYFEGERVKKKIFLVNQGDLGFGCVSGSGQEIAGMDLHHISCVKMFYILSSYLEFRGMETPRLKFSGLEDLENFDHFRFAKELLDRRERDLKSGRAFFDYYSRGAQGFFDVWGANYFSFYSAFLRGNKDLGFVRHERNGETVPEDLFTSLEDGPFCLDFSSCDAANALEGMVQVYEGSALALGFKRINDYFVGDNTTIL